MIDRYIDEIYIYIQRKGGGREREKKGGWRGSQRQAWRVSLGKERWILEGRGEVVVGRGGAEEGGGSTPMRVGVVEVVVA